MKNLLPLFAILLFSCTPKSVVNITENSPTPKKKRLVAEETVYKFYEDGIWATGTPDSIPSAKDNMGFVAPLYKNIRYPALARENGRQGIVYIAVETNEVGQVVDVKIDKGFDPECDAVALEAIQFVASKSSMMPLTKNGQPKRARFNFPIIFQLE